MTHLKYSLKKSGTKFKLLKEILKTEMNHDEIDENNWTVKKDERIEYVQNHVFRTTLSYARYSKAMEEITGFSMKDCLSLPRIGLKSFNSLKTEEDEPIYTYNDKYMRWFVRQSIRRGRVCAFSQYYKLEICADILQNISEELNVKVNFYIIIEAVLNCKNKHSKIFEKENENQFNIYRDEYVEEKEEYINKKLGQCPIQKLTKQIKIDERLWDFDAVS